MDEYEESVAVVERCSSCSVALAAVVTSCWDDGVVAVSRRQWPHTSNDCRRFAALMDEEWPARAVLRSSSARR